ncbi:MAG: hypothetical protein ACREP0_09240 [Rhodanobacteraceae bacterium]
MRTDRHPDEVVVVVVVVVVPTSAADDGTARYRSFGDPMASAPCDMGASIRTRHPRGQAVRRRLRAKRAHIDFAASRCDVQFPFVEYIALTPWARIMAYS